MMVSEFTFSSNAFIVVGLCLAVIQALWVMSVLASNRRQRDAQPLSSRDFQKELDRILPTIDPL